MNNQRSYALPTQALNKWFIASMVFCVIATILLIIAIVYGRMGSGMGAIASASIAALLFAWISLPFWVLAIGCAICGQLERLINAQNKPAPQYSVPNQPIPTPGVPQQMPSM